MHKVWDKIIGQDDVVRVLQNALKADKLPQTFLFVGPEGLGKTLAAKALAINVMCEEDSCGACPTCQRIMRETHPDFHIIEPQGTREYLVDQIRTLMHDMSFLPVQSKRKFYIIKAADVLNLSSANALLKTLEEPPPHVVIILFAHTIEPVLPTIVSRCIPVRFKTLPLPQMLDILSKKPGHSKEDALIALAATGSVLGDAASFMDSSARKSARRLSVRTFRNLVELDDLEILEATRELLVAINGPKEEMRQQQEADLELQADLLDSRAIRELKKLNERQLKAYDIRNINEFLNTIQSLLRDTLALSQGVDELVLNVDVIENLRPLSKTISAQDIAQSIEAIDKARLRIARNVGSALVIETVLFEIREVLRCPR